jgi:peptide/nickel transport system permease protein
MRFLGARLLQGISLLFVVCVASFLLLQVAPGHYFSGYEASPDVSQKTIEGLRQQSGLDVPIAQRLLQWVRSAIHGDFGNSLAYRLPVVELLRERATNTLVLTIISTTLAWLLGVPIGLLAAVHRNRILDRLFSLGTTTLISIPGLVTAFALIALAAWTGALPVGGMHSAEAHQLSWSGKIVDLGNHLLLPVITLVLMALPVITRHVRSTAVELLDATFVQAARAHGLRRRTILFRYVLRPASNSLISLFGFSIASLISGSFIVEIVMGWPGLGPLLLEAILARDLNIVLGAVILSSVFVVGANFIADMMLYVLDPRIAQVHR